MSTITVSARFVNLLRAALVSQLAECAGEIEASGNSHPDDGIDPDELDAFETCRALLEQVGSVRTVPAVKAEIELRSRAQREALTTALRKRLELEQYMTKVNRSTTDGAKQYREAQRYIRQIETFLSTAGLEDGGGIFTIPAETVARVRSGLYDELHNATGEVYEMTEMAGYEKAAEQYVEPFTRQDAARALLNVVGWEIIEEPVPVAIDLDAHQDVLMRAAQQDLDFQIWQSEDTNTREERRATARTNRALIEDLLMAIDRKA
jgi:hypothetical protein